MQDGTTQSLHTGNRFGVRLAAFLVFSSLLHGAFFLPANFESAKLSENHRKQFVSLAIRAPENKPLAGEAKHRLPVTKKPVPQEKHVAKPAALPSLKELLTLPPAIDGEPDPESASAMTGENRLPYAGPYLGELLAESSDLTASFDLPLVFRRFIEQGVAWVYLVRKEDKIYIEVLAGQKEIRAALYQALHLPENKKYLHSIFRYFGVERLKISFDFITHFAEPAVREFSSEQKIHQHEVQFIWHRYLNHPVFGVTSGAIEDEHSLAAKARDRKHWRQLRDVPAYKRIIRNELLY